MHLIATDKGEDICPEDGQIGRIQFGEGAQGLLAELK